MLSTRLATAITVAGLAIAALAGCSSTSTPRAESSTTKTPADGSAVVRTEPEQRQVTIVKLVDPSTVIATPVKSSDDLYGDRFVVHIDQITTPASNACGYDQALEFAKSHIDAGTTWSLQYPTLPSSVYIDAKGEHHGSLRNMSGGYDESAVTAGVATTNANTSQTFLQTEQDDAKANKTGLWGTCPDFGA